MSVCLFVLLVLQMDALICFQRHFIACLLYKGSTRVMLNNSTTLNCQYLRSCFLPFMTKFLRRQDEVSSPRQQFCQQPTSDNKTALCTGLSTDQNACSWHASNASFERLELVILMQLKHKNQLILVIKSFGYF